MMENKEKLTLTYEKYHAFPAKTENSVAATTKRVQR